MWDFEHVIWNASHHSDVIMSVMTSQISVSRLLTQPFIQAQIKENTKAPRHWPLWGEFTDDRWIPRTKGQQRGKYFHLMTSSWHASFILNLNEWLSKAHQCNIHIIARLARQINGCSIVFLFTLYMKCHIRPLAQYWWYIAPIILRSRAHFILCERTTINDTHHLNIFFHPLLFGTFWHNTQTHLYEKPQQHLECATHIIMYHELLIRSNPNKKLQLPYWCPSIFIW